MGALKYASGEEPMVGDVFVHPGYEVSEWTISHFDGEHWRCTGGGCIASISRAKLLRRAPSSPAPTPTDGDPRFLPGAVWAANWDGIAHTIVLSREGRNLRTRYVYWGRHADVPSTEQVCSEPMVEKEAYYAGNLSAVFAGLVRLHAPRIYGRIGATDTTPAPPPTAPPPLVDAEELAARQRAAHKLEAERLQERYAAFRADVHVTLNDVAPRAQWWTDKVSKGSEAFAVFIDFGDGAKWQHRYTISPSYGEHGVARDIRAQAKRIAGELGSRLLKGGGKR